MANVIGVRFRSTGKIYFFDPNGIDVHAGNGVIVETVRGIEYGEVVAGPREVEEHEIVAPLRKAVRASTPEDDRRAAENREKERRAMQICTERIEKHRLEMKLVDVEYSFDGSKIVFYFTADGRVDFRELVKDLASVFRTRIELRQIGVRDEAKMLGGIGPCGRVICCKQFLEDFHPVSIKMAKEQALSLNPTKISGLCSRLMCCLQYEQSHYERTRKTMPKVGSEVVVPEGRGVVVENIILKERVKIRLGLPDGSYDLREYPLSEIGLEKREVREEAVDEELSRKMDEFVGTAVRTPQPGPRPSQEARAPRKPRPNPPQRQPRPQQGGEGQAVKREGSAAPQQAQGDAPKRRRSRNRNRNRSNKPQQQPGATSGAQPTPPSDG